jgi:hypothetical protein
MFAKNYAISEKLQHIQLWKFAVFHTSHGTSSLPSMNKIRVGMVFLLVHLTWNDPKPNSHIPRWCHAVPLPCCAALGLDCLSHLIYKVQPRLIHTFHAVQMPCHSESSFSVPWLSMAWAWQGMGELVSAVLPAFVFFRLPRRVPLQLLSEANQSVNL